MCSSGDTQDIQRIAFTDVKGIRVGQEQDLDAMTGVTVLLFDKPALAAVDISGGGAACRESFLLSPLSHGSPIDAIVFSGGSSFSLDAATGVMEWLLERGRGLPVGGLRVPLVVQSCIFDLGIGSSRVRPDKAMAARACEAVLENSPRSGSFGAGTGATVGKVFGIRRAQKGGVGFAALKVGQLSVAVCAVVNAFADVFHWRTGDQLAGALSSDRTCFASTEAALYQMQRIIDAGGDVGAGPFLRSGGNTTLVAAMTNAALSRCELLRVSRMASSSLAHVIRPVGTTGDGDSVYAVSLGDVKSDVNIVGTLACRAVGEAIADAVQSAQMTSEAFLALLPK